MKICEWCEEKCKNNAVHICPPIFIHKISEREIVVRGRKLDVSWFKSNVTIGSRDE